MEQETNKKFNSKMIIEIGVAIAIIIIIIVAIIMINSSKTITLTSDNYEQYLKVNMSATGTFDSKYKVYLGTNYFNNSNQVSTAEEYKSILMNASASGLSSNYIYEDVEITIHFYGTLPLRKLKTAGTYNNKYAIIEPIFEETGEIITIDKIITIKCDSSGNSIAKSENSYTEQAKDGNYFSDEDIKNIQKDITIKGKIREVK